MKLLMWLNFLWAVAGGSLLICKHRSWNWPVCEKTSQAPWCIFRIFALERSAMDYGAYWKTQHWRDHLGMVLHIAILTLTRPARHHGAFLQLKHERDKPGAMVHVCDLSPGEASQVPWCIHAIPALERPPKHHAACLQSKPWRDQTGVVVHAFNPSKWIDQSGTMMHTCNPSIGENSQEQWCILAILALEIPARHRGAYLEFQQWIVNNNKSLGFGS